MNASTRNLLIKVHLSVWGVYKKKIATEGTVPGIWFTGL